MVIHLGLRFIACLFNPFSNGTTRPTSLLMERLLQSEDNCRKKGRNPFSGLLSFNCHT